MKLNCWEYKKCGRESGGSNVTHLGICSATLNQNHDLIHDGRNGGWSCWTVAGTYCKGEVQGTFAIKYEDCKSCDFYNLVREEEYPNFRLSGNILSQVRKRDLESGRV
jgi:hypothetical protein